MDLDFTEEQEMLRNMARDFLKTECPKTLVRAMEKDEKGYSPEIWRKMAEVGLLGTPFPEEYGGTGYTLVEMVIVLEEIGRVLLPSPYVSTIAVCGMAILSDGTEEQKKEFIPKIAQGEIILSLALTEPSARYDADAIAVKAAPDGGDFVIDGTKLFVHGAHVADYFLCVARTKDGAKPEEGITIFLVDAKSPGITCTQLEDTIAKDKQFEVVFNKVKVSKDNILGELDKGWPLVQKIMTYGAIAECACMLGGSQQVLEMSVAYAKERVTYGKPIGSYQQIQRYCVDILTDTDGSRYLTHQAAWKLAEGFPCDMEVAKAKAWVSDAYQRVCFLGHQIFGGIGFTTDSDMGLFYVRAKTQEINFGDADYHRELVAQQLGLDP